MEPTCFALKASRHVWEAIVHACAPLRPEPLVDEAIARVRARLPPEVTVRRDGVAIIVVHPELPADAIGPTALALERVVSSEAYRTEGGHVFLPYPCVGVACQPSEPAPEAVGRAKKAVHKARREWAALVWGGSAGASRLFLYSGSAHIGGDASCEIPIGAVDRPVARVEQKGRHLYIAPLDDPRRVLFNGRPLTRKQFYGPKSLIVVPDPGREPSTVILFEDAGQAAAFGKQSAFGWDDHDDGDRL